MTRAGFLVVLLAVASLRCGGGDAAHDAIGPTDAVSDEAAGVDAVEVHDAVLDAPAMPIPVCGLTSHAWLPFEGMGEVVAVEALPQYSYKKEMLAALLAGVGYADAFEARYDVAVLRVRYMTQDRGVRREATAAVGLPIPEGDEVVAATPTLVLHGTAGFTDPCAPSRGKDGPLAVAVFATQGQVAVAPDYLGLASMGAPSEMPHPYLVAEATAVASWDALRAAVGLLPEHAPALILSSQVLLFGGSQGGHAVLFVDRYAPHYAPEFEVLASVPLTAPADMLGETRAALEAYGPPTEALSAALVSLARWYGLEARLGEVLHDEAPFFYATAVKAMMDATDDCTIDVEELGVSAISDVFQPGFVAAVQAGTWEGFEDWRCVLAENSLPTTSVPRANDAPMFPLLSGNDELVNIAAERAAHVVMCEQGYELTQLECVGARHTEGPAWGVLEIFGWMTDRLAGEPLGPTCQHPAPVCCQGSPAETCTP
jgi:hypothetical protein